jgi:hypothetical protein
VTDERSTTLSTETPFEVPPSGPLAADLAEQLVEQTRAEGLDVVGPGGLGASDLLVPVGGIYKEAALEPIPIDRDLRGSAIGC